MSFYRGLFFALEIIKRSRLRQNLNEWIVEVELLTPQTRMYKPEIEKKLVVLASQSKQRFPLTFSIQLQGHIFPEVPVAVVLLKHHSVSSRMFTPFHSCHKLIFSTFIRTHVPGSR